MSENQLPYRDYDELQLVIDEIERRLKERSEALRQIDALDRAGHDSWVAAEMGFIARQALSSISSEK